METKEGIEKERKQQSRLKNALAGWDTGVSLGEEPGGAMGIVEVQDSAAENAEEFVGVAEGPLNSEKTPEGLLSTVEKQIISAKTPEGLLSTVEKQIISAKKYMLILPVSLVMLFVTIPAGQANAQFVIAEVIKLVVKKVIRAIDLKVQRLQNQTIWLQDAQKSLENQLSKLKLNEISGWTQKQKDLYSEYYQELWKIKSAIAYYSRLSDLTSKQLELVAAYHRAWGLLKADRHFTAGELPEMEKVYDGILQASIRDLDQILSVVNSQKTQMKDEKRMELINAAADHMDTNYSDLQRFNNQNFLLSIQRAKDENEVLTLRRYYGIQ